MTKLVVVTKKMKYILKIILTLRTVLFSHFILLLIRDGNNWGRLYLPEYKLSGYPNRDFSFYAILYHIELGCWFGT